MRKRLTPKPSNEDAINAIAYRKPVDDRTSGTPWLILGGIGVAVIMFIKKPVSHHKIV